MRRECFDPHQPTEGVCERCRAAGHVDDDIRLQGRALETCQIDGVAAISVTHTPTHAHIENISASHPHHRVHFNNVLMIAPLCVRACACVFIRSTARRSRASNGRQQLLLVRPPLTCEMRRTTAMEMVRRAIIWHSPDYSIRAATIDSITMMVMRRRRHHRRSL